MGRQMVTTLGGLCLGQEVLTASGLREFSADEYAMSRAAGWEPLSPNERLYCGEDINFKGFSWRLVVGVVEGRIYKIHLGYLGNDKTIADCVLANILEYFISEMDQYSEHDPEAKMYIWDRVEGNTILEEKSGFGYWGVNIFLTASFIRELKKEKGSTTKTYNQFSDRTLKLISYLLTNIVIISILGWIWKPLGAFWAITMIGGSITKKIGISKLVIFWSYGTTKFVGVLWGTLMAVYIFLNLVVFSIHSIWAKIFFYVVGLICIAYINYFTNDALTFDLADRHSQGLYVIQLCGIISYLIATGIILLVKYLM